MSDDDKVKSIQFYVTRSEYTEINDGSAARVTCTLVADLDKDVVWGPLQDKINKGWKVYESDSILHDALAVMQADLEKEKLRYQDLEREKATQQAVHDKAMGDLRHELARLQKMEKDLEALSGLGVRKVVR